MLILAKKRTSKNKNLKGILENRIKKRSFSPTMGAPPGFSANAKSGSSESLSSSSLSFVKLDASEAYKLSIVDSSVDKSKIKKDLFSSSSSLMPNSLLFNNHDSNKETRSNCSFFSLNNETDYLPKSRSVIKKSFNELNDFGDLGDVEVEGSEFEQDEEDEYFDKESKTKFFHDTRNDAAIPEWAEASPVMLSNNFMKYKKKFNYKI